MSERRRPKGEDGGLLPDMAESYDAYFASGLYQRRYPRPNRRTLRVLEKLLPEGGGLIDYGAGEGRYCLTLARSRAAKVVAVDISAVARAHLRERVAAEGLSDRIAVTDAEGAAYEALIPRRASFDVALLGFLSAYAVRFESRARVFTQLFRRLGTRRVFIVVAYSFPDIIEGAHRAGAHVVELQHGLMFRSHTGYDFPDSQDVQYRPDEIWLFGDHWRTAARHDPRTKLTVFGAPHIRARIAAAANRTGDRHGLIVLSQPAVTGQLSRFAIELASLPGTPHILYRLHPNESADAVREAARLSGLGPDRFEVSIGGGGTRTMELQAAHRYQLGVFSTAVVEGLALGCETMILGIPGWSALQSLVDDGLAKLVVTPEQAAAAMTGPPSAAAVVEADRFFA